MTDDAPGPEEAGPDELGPIALPTIEVRPDGPMAGRTLRMRYPSVRLWIANQRGDVSRILMFEEILLAIEEHDFGHDPASLPPIWITAIGDAWMDAIKDTAIPPVTGSD